MVIYRTYIDICICSDFLASATATQYYSYISCRKSIRLKSSPDIPVGAFSFRQPTTSHQRALYFGFFIYPPYQNKGYGKQAMRYLLDLAFEMDGKKWMAVQSGVMGWNDRGVAFFKGM